MTEKWRVPGHIIKKDNFLVGLSRSYEFNVENMKEYEITENFLEQLKKRNNKLWLLPSE